MRCRVVAQDLGFGDRLEELLAGTPSLIVVKLSLSAAAEKGLSMMLLDVQCAF